jgi:hypothetical protein
MAEQLDEAVKLLILLSHRAAALDVIGGPGRYRDCAIAYRDIGPQDSAADGAFVGAGVLASSPDAGGCHGAFDGAPNRTLQLLRAGGLVTRSNVAVVLDWKRFQRAIQRL